MMCIVRMRGTRRRVYLGFLEGSVATSWQSAVSNRGCLKSGVTPSQLQSSVYHAFTAILAFHMEMAPNPSELCLLGLPYALTAIDASMSLVTIQNFLFFVGLAFFSFRFSFKLRSFLTSSTPLNSLFPLPSLNLPILFSFAASTCFFLL